jgi:hypothetical protein
MFPEGVTRYASSVLLAVALLSACSHDQEGTFDPRAARQIVPRDSTSASLGIKNRDLAHALCCGNGSL